MQQKLKLVDCVIEVHDARVSFHVCLQTDGGGGGDGGDVF
jgi:hypothetical protein